ncbi:unnamed protein product [Clonostachys chloroleuca]|uniref:Uncharacterized protein n=1 Tax=Clonostachys chloroleuca TaxID=1926264 RepID=A0AA35QBH5_9HYPO|nr:unnamed protein product [Clonostachys chloroleuca]
MLKWPFQSKEVDDLVRQFSKFVQAIAHTLQARASALLVQSEDCGKLSCRLCQSLAHEGKTCEEAKLPDLAEDVEEQTRQLTRLLDEAMSEGRFLNCSRCKVGIELSSGCNKIRCTCNHYQWYYCRASLVSIKDEDDIQVAQKEAEDAIKKALANSGGLDARAIQLKDDYAQKRRAANKKAYGHFEDGPATIYRTNCIPTPQLLHCKNQVRRIMMMKSRILDHYQNCVNKNILDDLIKKLMVEQRESWKTLIRDAKLDLTANPFPGDEA